MPLLYYSKHEKALGRKQKLQSPNVWSWGVKCSRCMKHTRKRPLHDYCCVATQFTWIFTVLLQVAKKVLKVPITQAAKLFEGERENDLMKKKCCYWLPSGFYKRCPGLFGDPFWRSKGSNDWSFLRSSFMIMNATEELLLTLKLEVLMAIFRRFIKLLR